MTIRAEQFKEEKQKKALTKSTGWFGFGGSSSGTTKQASQSSGLDVLVNQSLVQQIEADIEKQIEIEEQMTTQFAL